MAEVAAPVIGSTEPYDHLAAAAGLQHSLKDMRLLIWPLNLLEDRRKWPLTHQK